VLNTPPSATAQTPTVPVIAIEDASAPTVAAVGSHHPGQERRDQRRQHDLAEDGGDVHRARSGGRERGTDESAER